jgi:isoamylase
MNMTVLSGLEAGSAEPLGATWDGRGINFALFSANGEQVELCLFDETGRREVRRLTLPARTGDIWHGYLAGARPGLKYGYRVHGPYAPGRGHRFNPHKLLLDPYARAITGAFTWHRANFAYDLDSPSGDLSFETTDNAPFVPKGIVTPPSAANLSRLETPWHDTVIYEMHVKGMTQRHPDVPAPLRGTFAALTAPAIVDHMRSLGVTAIELLPVFAFADETHLVRRGLANYWGYNPVSFFALDPRYLAGGGLREVVDIYHAAGIEVLVDVVYNHTAEGDRLGPTLSLRGIDNASYYWLDDHGNDVNYSGCGNTLNVCHPQVQRLVLDSLKHLAWSTGIDGFRFDLAATLARTPRGFCLDTSLAAMIARDPQLSALKLIAEPWDVGGHILGHLPPPWREWNDRYRDTMRAFWRGDAHMAGRAATALAGSSNDMRAPLRGINFITAHDGFTLEDLVSYARKHNDANGEGGRDGTDHNLSANYGAEGPDESLRPLRDRQKRNFIASLMLSQGVPMMLAGDEFGQTQGGNNNAYCQDNDTTWLDWGLLEANRDLVDFVRQVIALRKSYPALRREAFFTGDNDIIWLRPDGAPMTETDWNDPARYAFGFMIAGQLLIYVNANEESVAFVPPKGRWRAVLCTGDGGRSLTVLERNDD